MTAAEIRPGAIVEWDTWCGPTRAEVVSISRDGIVLRSSDGHAELHPTGRFITLDDIARPLRVVPTMEGKTR